MSDAGRKEKEDLEAWIRANPEILGQDVVLIGEQVPTGTGFMDFLGIDSSGNTVVVELKRDRLARDVLAQAIDYASVVSSWGVEKLGEICESNGGQTLEDLLQEKFPEVAIEDLAVNQAQRLLLVGFGIEDPLSRMIEWLSDNYSVGINAIMLTFVKTQGGDEVLSRSVVIPEEVEKQKANKKKFNIEMSDEAGEYDEETLRAKLGQYLSKSLYSAQRIRDYFLPVLIEKGLVTRDVLRKEFVSRGGAPDESQAGYFLSLISSQLGHKWKDYLRQVIEYEYPNHPWEKDNFRIREGYQELVKELLAETTDNTT